jgi:hypothetical protein
MFDPLLLASSFMLGNKMTRYILICGKLCHNPIHYHELVIISFYHEYLDYQGGYGSFFARLYHTTFLD